MHPNTEPAGWDPISDNMVESLFVELMVIGIGWVVVLELVVGGVITVMLWVLSLCRCTDPNQFSGFVPVSGV